MAAAVAPVAAISVQPVWKSASRGAAPSSAIRPAIPSTAPIWRKHEEIALPVE